VHQGRGSAFFLHVTDGRATAGCVAISQTRLASIMKWLTPTAHPRILIGVA
jgi:L,D-peptidoglycan transpeptidase YkuD (ErfK/YbiS/YcfS/YnhG family)